MVKGISGGGGRGIAAPRVAASPVSVGGTKTVAKRFAGGPETGGIGGNVATQFSSRGLEAYRHLGPRNASPGAKDSLAGSKMRVTSFGDPVSTSSVKAELSKPGITGPQRSKATYAPESAFAKPEGKGTPINASLVDGLKTAPFKPNVDSLNPANGGKAVPTTSEQVRSFKEQSAEQALQQLNNQTVHADQLNANKERVSAEGKSVTIDWTYNPKKANASTVAKDTISINETIKNSGLSDNPVAKSPNAEVSANTSPNGTANTSSSENQKQVNAVTEVRGDISGNLSPQQVANLIQQPAFTGEAKPVDNTPQKIKDSVRRLPDIKTQKPVTPAEAAAELSAQKPPQVTVSDPIMVEDRKVAIKQELQRIEQQQHTDSNIVHTSSEHIVNEQKAEANVLANKTREVTQPTEISIKNGAKTLVIKQETRNTTQTLNTNTVGSSTPDAKVGHQNTSITNNQVEAVSVTDTTDTVRENNITTTHNAPEITVTPINPDQKAPEITVELPKESKFELQSDERAKAFQNELESIKEQVAALVAGEQSENNEVIRNADPLQKNEIITVLPDAQPLPVPDVVLQPTSQAAEFGNLLKRRQQEKLKKPISVTDPDGQSELSDSDNVVTVKVHRTSSLKDKVKAQFVKVTEVTKSTAKTAAGFVGKYSVVIDWDEIFDKKRKNSVYNEITKNSKVSAAKMFADTISSPQVENASVQSTGTVANIPLVNSNIHEATTAVISAQPMGNHIISQQQEEALVKLFPQTKPINIPDAVTQLHNQSEQGNAQILGNIPEVEVFNTKKDSILDLILDIEAKKARQQAIERSVRSAVSTPDDIVTGADVVAAADDKHTAPLISGAAKELGLNEDGTEVILWNRIGAIEAMPRKEMLGMALQEEASVRPVTIGEHGSNADEKDLALVLSKVNRNEELALVN